jgi:Kef-type K+ transport system membrane component KefB
MSDVQFVNLLAIVLIAFLAPLLLGFAFLLFLAGLEIDVHRLRGRLLRVAVLGYVISLMLGGAA